MHKKNIKKFLSVVALLFVIFPIISWAATNSSGITIPTSSETGLSDLLIEDILKKVLTWMLGVIGIVALIGFVISGAMYIFSSGDDKQAETAKSAMKNSIIGVIVVLGAFVIIQAIDYALRGSSFF